MSQSLGCMMGPSAMHLGISGAFLQLREGCHRARIAAFSATRRAHAPTPFQMGVKERRKKY